jgi:anti-sigma B factor antagonist
LDANIVRVVVDLSEVGFVDSSGLGVLIAAQKRANRSGGQVMLSAPSETVSNTLQLVRLDKVLGVLPTVEAAKSALKSS